MPTREIVESDDIENIGQQRRCCHNDPLLEINKLQYAVCATGFNLTAPAAWRRRSH